MQVTNTKHSTGRDHFGDLYSRTYITFDTKGRQLRLETSKNSRGALVTSASVGAITSDGMGWSHCFSFGGAADDDFRRDVLKTPNKRATAKAIQLQHEQALSRLDALITDVGSFYAPRDAR